MCDMQKMPTREDASCEEDSDMNFATFSTVGTAGTHFVTTGGQLPVAKLQQNVTNNGTGMQQLCVAMGDGGVQYMRALDGSVQAAPQLISVPIQLAGAKPGDPQPTVQIQVLTPSMLQAQQQPKYQMQIPIQGFQQGGAVLTVAYSPEANETGGIQLVGQGSLGEGLQVLAALPQEMQLVQQTQDKDHMQQNMHQVFITPNQQIIINAPENKTLNNNTTSDNNNSGPIEVIIKEECDENVNDDESSQGTEASDSLHWQLNQSHQQDLVKYLSTLPPQQTQALPVSLQQFLRLNPTDVKKSEPVDIEIEMDDVADDKIEEPVAEAVLSEGKRVNSNSKLQIPREQLQKEDSLSNKSKIGSCLQFKSAVPKPLNENLVYSNTHSIGSSNKADTGTKLHTKEYPNHSYDTNELQNSSVSAKNLTDDISPEVCPPIFMNQSNQILQPLIDNRLITNLEMNTCQSKKINFQTTYPVYKTGISRENFPSETNTRTDPLYNSVRPSEECSLITNPKHSGRDKNVFVTNPKQRTFIKTKDCHLTTNFEFEKIVPVNDIPNTSVQECIPEPRLDPLIGESTTQTGVLKKQRAEYVPNKNQDREHSDDNVIVTGPYHYTTTRIRDFHLTTNLELKVLGKCIDSNSKPQTSREPVQKEDSLLNKSNIGNCLQFKSAVPKPLNENLVYSNTHSIGSSNKADTGTKLHTKEYPNHSYDTNDLQNSSVSAKNLTHDISSEVCPPIFINQSNQILKPLMDNRFTTNLEMNTSQSENVNFRTTYSVYKTGISRENFPSKTNIRTDSLYNTVRPPEECSLMTNPKHSGRDKNVFVKNPKQRTLMKTQDCHLTTNFEFEKIVPVNAISNTRTFRVQECILKPRLAPLIGESTTQTGVLKKQRAEYVPNKNQNHENSYGNIIVTDPCHYSPMRMKDCQLMTSFDEGEKQREEYIPNKNQNQDHSDEQLEEYVPNIIQNHERSNETVIITNPYHYNSMTLKDCHLTTNFEEGDEQREAYVPNKNQNQDHSADNVIVTDINRNSSMRMKDCHITTNFEFENIVPVNDIPNTSVQECIPEPRLAPLIDESMNQTGLFKDSLNIEKPLESSLTHILEYDTVRECKRHGTDSSAKPAYDEDIVEQREEYLRLNSQPIGYIHKKKKACFVLSALEENVCCVEVEHRTIDTQNKTVPFSMVEFGSPPPNFPPIIIKLGVLLKKYKKQHKKKKKCKFKKKMRELFKKLNKLLKVLPELKKRKYKQICKMSKSNNDQVVSVRKRKARERGRPPPRVRRRRVIHNPSTSRPTVVELSNPPPLRLPQTRPSSPLTPSSPPQPTEKISVTVHNKKPKYDKQKFKRKCKESKSKNAQGLKKRIKHSGIEPPLPEHPMTNVHRDNIELLDEHHVPGTQNYTTGQIAPTPKSFSEQSLQHKPTKTTNQFVSQSAVSQNELLETLGLLPTNREIGQSIQYVTNDHPQMTHNHESSHKINTPVLVRNCSNDNDGPPNEITNDFCKENPMTGEEYNSKEDQLKKNILVVTTTPSSQDPDKIKQALLVIKPNKQTTKAVRDRKRKAALSTSALEERDRPPPRVRRRRVIHNPSTSRPTDVELSNPPPLRLPQTRLSSPLTPSSPPQPTEKISLTVHNKKPKYDRQKLKRKCKESKSKNAQGLKKRLKHSGIEPPLPEHPMTNVHRDNIELLDEHHVPGTQNYTTGQIAPTPKSFSEQSLQHKPTKTTNQFVSQSAVSQNELLDTLGLLPTNREIGQSIQYVTNDHPQMTHNHESSHKINTPVLVRNCSNDNDGPPNAITNDFCKENPMTGEEYNSNKDQVQKNILVVTTPSSQDPEKIKQALLVIKPNKQTTKVVRDRKRKAALSTSALEERDRPPPRVRRRRVIHNPSTSRPTVVELSNPPPLRLPQTRPSSPLTPSSPPQPTEKISLTVHNKKPKYDKQKFKRKCKESKSKNAQGLKKRLKHSGIEPPLPEHPMTNVHRDNIELLDEHHVPGTQNYTTGQIAPTPKSFSEQSLQHKPTKTTNQFVSQSAVSQNELLETLGLLPTNREIGQSIQYVTNDHPQMTHNHESSHKINTPVSVRDCSNDNDGPPNEITNDFCKENPITGEEYNSNEDQLKKNILVVTTPSSQDPEKIKQALLVIKPNKQTTKVVRYRKRKAALSTSALEERHRPPPRVIRRRVIHNPSTSRPTVVELSNPPPLRLPQTRPSSPLTPSSPPQPTEKISLTVHNKKPKYNKRKFKQKCKESKSKNAQGLKKRLKHSGIEPPLPEHPMTNVHRDNIELLDEHHVPGTQNYTTGQIAPTPKSFSEQSLQHKPTKTTNQFVSQSAVSQNELLETLGLLPTNREIGQSIQYVTNDHPQMTHNHESSHKINTPVSVRDCSNDNDGPPNEITNDFCKENPITGEEYNSNEDQLKKNILVVTTPSSQDPEKIKQALLVIKPNKQTTKVVRYRKRKAALSTSALEERHRPPPLVRRRRVIHNPSTSRPTVVELSNPPPLRLPQTRPSSPLTPSSPPQPTEKISLTVHNKKPKYNKRKFKQKCKESKSKNAQGLKKRIKHSGIEPPLSEHPMTYVHRDNIELLDEHHVPGTQNYTTREIAPTPKSFSEQSLQHKPTKTTNQFVSQSAVSQNELLETLGLLPTNREIGQSIQYVTNDHPQMTHNHESLHKINTPVLVRNCSNDNDGPPNAITNDFCKENPMTGEEYNSNEDQLQKNILVVTTPSSQDPEKIKQALLVIKPNKQTTKVVRYRKRKAALSTSALEERDRPPPRVRRRRVIHKPSTSRLTVVELSNSPPPRLPQTRPSSPLTSSSPLQTTGKPQKKPIVDQSLDHKIITSQFVLQSAVSQNELLEALGLVRAGPCLPAPLHLLQKLPLSPLTPSPPPNAIANIENEKPRVEKSLEHKIIKTTSQFVSQSAVSQNELLEALRLVRAEPCFPAPLSLPQTLPASPPTPSLPPHTIANIENKKPEIELSVEHKIIKTKSQFVSQSAVSQNELFDALGLVRAGPCFPAPLSLPQTLLASPPTPTPTPHTIANIENEKPRVEKSLEHKIIKTTSQFVSQSAVSQNELLEALGLVRAEPCLPVPLSLPQTLPSSPVTPTPTLHTIANIENKNPRVELSLEHKINKTTSQFVSQSAVSQNELLEALGLVRAEPCLSGPLSLPQTLKLSPLTSSLPPHTIANIENKKPGIELSLEHKIIKTTSQFVSQSAVSQNELFEALGLVRVEPCLLAPLSLPQTLPSSPLTPSVPPHTIANIENKKPSVELSLEHKINKTTSQFISQSAVSQNEFLEALGLIRAEPCLPARLSLPQTFPSSSLRPSPITQLTASPTTTATLADGTLRIQSKKKKKYKKKPPKPARPKPGQVVIATAVDGSPIFCCPECQMAYSEKEQLEIHLIVHKIERRFICGICGAGLKRKEHLERHKLGHNPERPYVCGVCRKGFKRREHLNLHTVIHSGVKTEMCTECGKGFYRKDHLRKHTRSHETKRARDEAAGDSSPAPVQPASGNNNIMPEITIHIPTSSNSQMPVQINIPQHVVSSLAASQQHAAEQSTLDALLAHHS